MGRLMRGGLVLAVALGLAGCTQVVEGTPRPDVAAQPPVATTTAGQPPAETTPEARPPAEPVEVSTLDLSVGDCVLDDLGGSSVSTVRVVPCDVEHQFEVYAVEEMSGGAFPGSEEVSAEAGVECRDAFADFVGVDYDESDLYLRTLFPSESSWAGGDREIVCFIYDLDQATVGTLRGAGR